MPEITAAARNFDRFIDEFATACGSVMKASVVALMRRNRQSGSRCARSAKGRMTSGTPARPCISSVHQMNVLGSLVAAPLRRTGSVNIHQ